MGCKYVHYNSHMLTSTYAPGIKEVEQVIPQIPILVRGRELYE